MECNTINEHETLVNYLRSEDEVLLSRVFSCFNKLFYGDFKGFSFNNFFSKMPFTKSREDELARQAFDDGLLEFYFSIRQNGFKEKTATVKTLFFNFCKYKLWGLTTELRRNSERFIKDGTEYLARQQDEAYGYDYPALLEEMQKINERDELLQIGLSKLGVKCLNLLKWRKIEKLSNEEIAERSGMLPVSVANAVFRCNEELKKIVKALK